jgi:DNA-binding MarR family transcriptional regulator
MTVRLHRLEDAGLIRRTPNPHDGRGVLVRLTQAGVDLAEHAFSTVLDAQAGSIRSLAPPERSELADLLRTLLEGLGDVPAFRPPILVERAHE